MTTHSCDLDCSAVQHSPLHFKITDEVKSFMGEESQSTCFEKSAFWILQPQTHKILQTPACIFSADGDFPILEKCLGKYVTKHFIPGNNDSYQVLPGNDGS